MWYKVHELNQKDYSKSRISRETGLDRTTVRRYLQMTENEFHNWISNPRKMPLKLSIYTDFVRKELEGCPELSAAQIEDHLKEHFDDFPEIHSKTIFNFVQRIRKKYNIPKPKLTEPRIFEKLPSLPYGQQAQVDFGETWLQTREKKRKKVYFYAIVLSRSRYKYVYFSDKPFTSKKAIEAHDQGFEYFQGVPKEILYDQDSVFIHNENLGDYLLTEAFGTYCKTQNFKQIFCRKADPQTKGKVENVVKYVKQNFLRGRKFINIEILQQQAVEWLERTANKKVHATTQKVPKECWTEEKKHLLPIKNRIKQQVELKSYNVRKDNTIVYKSNYYSLPAGTYKKQGTQVFLEINDNEMIIYSSEKEQIATHKISIGKGDYVRNTDHARAKSDTLQAMQSQALNLLGETEIAKYYLEKLHRDKPRYYRDNLHEIIKQISGFDQKIINESITICTENNQLNAFDLIRIIKSKQVEKQQSEKAETMLKTIEQQSAQNLKNEVETKVSTSNINDYEKAFAL